MPNYFGPFDMELEGTDPSKAEGCTGCQKHQSVPGGDLGTLSLRGNKAPIMDGTRVVKPQRRWIQPNMERTQLPFCLPFFSHLCHLSNTKFLVLQRCQGFLGTARGGAALLGWGSHTCPAAAPQPAAPQPSNSGGLQELGGGIEHPRGDCALVRGQS